MNLFIEHKRIISIVAAVMVAVLVMYSYGSFTSYAAAPEISTLPADIDIDVSYDADTVTFTYNSVSHSISRKSRYEWLNIKGSSAYPYTLESNISGYYVPASYWFSPSENRLYVFSGTTGYGITSSTDLDDFSYILGYVASANNATSDIVGNFYTHNNSYNKYEHYMYFVDYNNNYICNSSNICTRNGDSKDRLMCCWASSNGSYINGVRADEYLNEDSYWHYFPTDLICIFSNYNISGFYEIDTSKVNTPSYYFNYQYIFFNKDYGYIFVDSADKVKEIGYPSSVNNPRFYFNSVCNSYVYTSVDGISWTLKTSLSTLYSDSFDLKTSYALAGNLQLVYTNDNTYGEEPLVTPDYGDITDITDNLNSFLKDFDIISSSGRGSSITSLDYLIVEFPADNSLLSSFVGSFTLDYVYYCTYKFYTGSGTTSMPEYIHVYYFGGTVYDNVIVKSSSDTGNKFFDFLNGTLIDPNNSYQLVSTSKVPTFSMYFRLLNNTTSNIFTSLTAMRTDLHADLKSVFKNITLTNQYLKKIFDNLDSLSIPAALDYSGDFDKLSAALDKLHNDLIYEEGVTKLPNVPQYLVYVYGVTKDIRTKLDNINVQISDDIVTFRKAVISRFDPVTDKLDSIIAKIPSSSGGGSFDDSNMVGSIVSLKSDISDNFNTLIKLLKNDTDGIENIADLTSFLTTYVVSMGNAAYFTTLLEFADGVKNNVTLINETMGSMFTDSGIYAPVFTLGAGFAVFSGLIRKERMD